VDQLTKVPTNSEIAKIEDETRKKVKQIEKETDKKEKQAIAAPKTAAPQKHHHHNK